MNKNYFSLRLKTRGMTLVEVMLALALFAVLALFVITIIRSVLGIWQAGERRGRGDLVFASAIEQMRSDFRALHHGPRGWLLLDEWEAAPAENEKPAWMLPRVRFLARGASLPSLGQNNQGAVEVAWLLVPENPAKSRLTQLVRVTLDETDNGTLRNDTRLTQAIQAGGAMVVLDGVAWLSWEADDPVQGDVTTVEIPAHTPFDFPLSLTLSLDRVSGNARSRPPILDADLLARGGPMVLRGNFPLKVPERVLVDTEWVGVRGDFPRLLVTGRGVRGELPAAHSQGEPVWIPEAFEAKIPMPSWGRRIQP